MTPADIDAYFRQLGVEHGLKLGDLAQPVRLAVTGRLVSAGLFEVLSLLPWPTVEARLRRIQHF
jgi:glutamyl-tRNA synthetase